MSNKHYKGFSLIELMVALGIASIIAVIAAGVYGDQVIAAKRTDGRAGAQNVAITLEKCKSLYGSYNSAKCSVANGESIASPEGLYDVNVVSAASTFTVTATPSSGSSQTEDTDCTSMILDHLGIKSGTGASSTTCW